MDIQNLFNNIRGLNQERARRIAVEWLYERFANYLIRLQPYGREEPNLEINDNMDFDGEIVVTGDETCNSYVRAFGSWISKLFIIFGENRGLNLNLCRRVNRECHESLRDITMRRFSQDQLFQLYNESPFTNVRKVRIENSNGRIDLAAFAQIFPNVVTLEIVDVEFENRRNRAANLENLLHLQIVNNIEEDFENIMNISNLWGPNDLLQSIVIRFPNASNLKWGNLMPVIELNTAIMRLEVHTKLPTKRIPTLDFYQIDAFCGEYRQLRVLQLDSFKFIIQRAKRFFRELPYLHTFVFQIVQNADWGKFLKHHHQTPYFVPLENNGNLVTLYFKRTYRID